MTEHYDVSGLSPRNLRLLMAGVRGGDENDPSGDPPKDEAAADEAPASEEQAAPEGEATSTEEPAVEAEAPFQISDLPEDLTETDEQVLRDLFAGFQAQRDEFLPQATPAMVPLLEEIDRRQRAIVEEIERRAEIDRQAMERLTALTNAEQVPTLPEPRSVPALASAAVVAGARTPGNPALQESTTPRRERPRAALIAAAGINVATPGSELSVPALGEAIDALKSGGGRTILASVQSFAEMDDDLPAPLLKTNAPEVNSELIREAQADFMALRRGEDPARMAAARTATICEPFDILRDRPSSFSAAEPVSAELPSRPAGRLGFQFFRSINLAAVSAAVDLWDETDQSTVDVANPATWKPCIDVPCDEPTTVVAEAVVACLRFDITTEMSNPETIRNYMDALDAQRARTKQARLLQRLDTLSSAYTFAGSYGALPTLIEAINEAVSRATFTNRQEDPDYTLFINPITAALLRIDRANRAYGVEAEVSDVLTYLRNSIESVNRVVVTLDESAGGEPGLPPPGLNPPGAAAVALLKQSGEHRIRLIDPRTFIYAETGQTNTGVQRSPDLMRMNKAQLFGEEFFFVERTGPWANFSIDVDLCDDGSRAGLIDPHGCASSA